MSRIEFILEEASWSRSLLKDYPICEALPRCDKFLVVTPFDGPVTNRVNLQGFVWILGRSMSGSTFSAEL